MPINSRWTEPIPSCSLQQWIFGSPTAPLPDRKAFIDPDSPDTHFLTQADNRTLAKRIALGLISAGLKPGDRVLLFSGNHIYIPPIFLGILMAGGIFTGANPTFVPRELAYQLSDSGATFMIAARTALPTALEAAELASLPQSHIYLFDGPASQPSLPRATPGASGRISNIKHWTELLTPMNHALAPSWSWIEPANPSTTTCALNYSSGTTGVPKGVEITHTNYVANGVGVITNSKLEDSYPAKTARARALCFLPLYHAYAQTYFVANLPKQGVPVYIMPQFDFVKMLAHVERFRITSLLCVPPVVVALAKSPLARRTDLSSIEGVGSGAAPLGREIADEVEKLWPAGGVLVRQGWGMTEVTCTCMSWDPRNPRPSGAGVGEISANCRAKLMAVGGEAVRDEERREIMETNTPGELWVSGPTLMKGYWKKPGATAGTLVVDKDGTRWLKTGDIAYVEGTYGPGAVFYIVDRLKELIKVKGNQVAPAELEAVLLDSPDVEDAAVVGVTIQGEEYPRAYLKMVAGSSVTEREMAKWMEKRVAKHKYLRGGVVFVDAVPKTVSGKILRKVLRERAAKEVGDSAPLQSRL